MDEQSDNSENSDEPPSGDSKQKRVLKPVFAIRKYSKQISENPNDPKLYYLRGNAYIRIKKYKEAIRDYTKAIAIDDDFLEAYYRRAVAQIRLGLIGDALKDYYKANEIHEDDEYDETKERICELLEAEQGIGYYLKDVEKRDYEEAEDPLRNDYRMYDDDDLYDAVAHSGYVAESLQKEYEELSEMMGLYESPLKDTFERIDKQSMAFDYIEGRRSFYESLNDEYEDISDKTSRDESQPKPAFEKQADKQPQYEKIAA